jgi:hypothetical protein
MKKIVELGECTIKIISKALRLGVSDMRLAKENTVELGKCTIKITSKALRF